LPPFTLVKSRVALFSTGSALVPRFIAPEIAPFASSVPDDGSTKIAVVGFFVLCSGDHDSDVETVGSIVCCRLALRHSMTTEPSIENKDSPIFISYVTVRSSRWMEWAPRRRGLARGSASQMAIMHHERDFSQLSLCALLCVAVAINRRAQQESAS
jgi:hypothetical protein